MRTHLLLIAWLTSAASGPSKADLAKAPGHHRAFSYGGKSWETNWTADFTRADLAKECAGGRPKK